MGNVFDSLHSLLVFSSRDAGANEEDAWLYGIIVGWEDEDGSAMNELREKFRWDDQTVLELRSLHTEFRKVKEAYDKRHG